QDAYPLMGPVNRTNTHPIARFTVVPTVGNASTAFAVNASETTDGEDPTADLEVRWDWDGDWQFDTPWTSTKTAEHTYTASGAHLLRLLVRDTGGLLDAAEHIVLVDETPPVTNVTLEGSPGVGGWFRSPVEVTLQATDNLTGIESTFYRTDGSPWTAYVGPIAVVEEGTTHLEYYSSDTAGNVEPVQGIDVRIDTAPPGTEVDLEGTTGDDGWYVTPVNVIFLASDATSGVNETLYRVDGGPWLPYSTSLALQADGTHLVEYRSVDRAGNVETVHELEVRIDRTRPALELLFPSPEAIVTADSLEVSWSVSDPTSGLQACALSLDGADPIPLGTATSSSVGPLGDGIHNVTVTCEDVAGNIATSQAKFRVDTSWFSPTGPVGPWLLIGLGAIASIGAVMSLWIWRWRKRSSGG
ncbi:MAG: OmpL47-type beta-barrel domain-containing protein, partial [Armatimonadota bacterium]